MSKFYESKLSETVHFSRCRKMALLKSPSHLVLKVFLMKRRNGIQNRVFCHIDEFLEITVFEYKENDIV